MGLPRGGAVDGGEEDGREEPAEVEKEHAPGSATQGAR